MASRISVKHAFSNARNEETAVSELACALGSQTFDIIYFFCSTSYDREKLAAELRRLDRGPLVGCTSAGQLGPNGFQRGGISAVGLASSELTISSYPIAPLTPDPEPTFALVQRAHAELKLERGARAFAILLIDGQSKVEEPVVAATYKALGGVPLVGGSAGADEPSHGTYVFSDGRFVKNTAVLTLVSTTLPFTSFKFQQIRAGDRRLVVTAADPERRVIHELNGEPAARAYARLLKLPVDKLDQQVFSAYPLVCSIGGEPYVRSVAAIGPDQSLHLYCAIEVGLVLSIGENLDPLEAVDAALGAVKAEIGKPAVVLGFDCILRRMHHEQQGLDGAVGERLGGHSVAGFSTYGEQWNAVHVNQTFTGVAIGGGL